MGTTEELAFPVTHADAAEEGRMILAKLELGSLDRRVGLRVAIKEKVRISRREIEGMLTADMRKHYPTARRVSLMPVVGGWRCFVHWRLTPIGRTIPPTEHADELLAGLLRRYEIVE
jgi:hypothetical protein